MDWPHVTHRHHQRCPTLDGRRKAKEGRLEGHVAVDDGSGNKAFINDLERH